jgi:hypothetical protein
MSLSPFKSAGMHGLTIPCIAHFSPFPPQLLVLLGGPYCFHFRLLVLLVRVAQQLLIQVDVKIA